MIPARYSRLSSFAASVVLPCVLAVFVVYVYAAAISRDLAAGSSHSAGFAYDFRSYFTAATDMLSGGSPYLPEQLRPGFPAQIEIAYRYPPAFAWWLMPLVGLGFMPLAAAFLALSVVALVASLALVYRAAGGRDWRGLLVLEVLGLGYFPVLEGLRLGNVSALLAALTGLALAGGPVLRASSITAASWLKVTPAALLPALVFGGHWRRTLASIAVATVVICLPSFVTHPAAWRDFFVSLQYGVASGDIAYANNFTPSGLVSYYLPALAEFATPLRWVTLLGCAAAGLASVILARAGRWPVALFAATAVSLFAAPTLWVHYFSVLVPFAAYAVVRATRRERIALGAAVAPMLIFFPFSLHPLLLAGSVAISIALVACILLRQR